MVPYANMEFFCDVIKFIVYCDVLHDVDNGIGVQISSGSNLELLHRLTLYIYFL